MDELAFEGTPLGDLTAPPDPRPTGPAAAPPGGAALGPPDPRSTVPATLPVRMADQLQRAHAAVLDAHQAIRAWQIARTAPHRAAAEAARRPVGVHAGGPPAAGQREVFDGAAAVLAAAATALRDSATGPGDATVVTWLGTAPERPTALRVDPAPATTPPAWQVRDGDRLIATLARHPQGAAWPARPVPRFPRDPRPVARTSVDRLSAAELDALAAGEFAEVFGTAFDQRGLPPDALPAPWPARLLDEVTRIEPGGGRYAHGMLRATAQPAVEERTGAWPPLVTATTELLRIHAFHRGTHLCLPGARAVPLTDRPFLVEVVDGAALRGATVRLEVEVTDAGMVPRPFLVADCRVSVGDRLVARVRDVGIALREAPGNDLSMAPGRVSCRRSAAGGWAAAHEVQVAIAAEGELNELATGSRDAPITAPVRPRLPRGDLLMIDRCRQGEVGAWREYPTGSWCVYEYDVPEDPWYLRESGGVLPQLALMEMALQPAGMFGGSLGVHGEYPDQELVCRNLEGGGRLLREVDLRGATVEQRVTLTSHTALPGGILHRYGFTLSTGGEPFHTGEAVHGYFTPEPLAQQQGMDGGRRVPPWLDRHSPAPADVRRLDLRQDARLGRGRMALLEDVVLVPGGGEHGAGYLLCDKPVRPDDWYFEQHFFRDPVMPGSAGVEMLCRAAYAYALHSGLLDHLPSPRWSIAVGEELRWSYRGQILRDHRRVRGEVHVREVRRDGDRVLIRADGSVYRDDLRIYHVENIAVQAGPAAGSR